MASSNTTSFQCPVCKEGYSLKEHRPKILPCDHTICKLCIKTLGCEFQCPVCCYNVKSSDFVGMTTNFVALEITEKLHNDGNLPEHDDEELDLSQISKKNTEATSFETDQYDTVESEDSGEKTPTRSEDFSEFCLAESVESKHNISSSNITNTESNNFCSSISEDVSAEDLDLDLDCKFSNAFDLTSQKMSTFESHIEHLRCSKEDTLKDIEAEYEHLVQLILRRKQFLKNQVMTQYEEKLEELEEKMEKVTFTTMCLTSLQKHSELVFNEFNNSYKDQAEVNEKSDTNSAHKLKLHKNIQKVDSEIEELVEQLNETHDGCPKEDFVYQSYGTENVEKGIRTLGRVKLQSISAGAEIVEASEFD